jgi:16S rRNA (guanine527-N7)-methyltransferase
MPGGSEARLLARARALDIEIPPPVAGSLAAYYDLLFHWNRKINLTALSDSEAAIDRLLLEPVIAAGVLPRLPRLMDLGSGGGSPAIPLALVLEAPLLVMVESRGRKAAFLREAARATGLRAVVEAVRFEELTTHADYQAALDVVSIRAVRMDEATISLAEGFIRPGGRLALFTTVDEDFRGGRATPLLDRGQLVQFDVPRETI